MFFSDPVSCEKSYFTQLFVFLFAHFMWQTFKMTKGPLPKGCTSQWMREQGTHTTSH